MRYFKMRYLLICLMLLVTPVYPQPINTDTVNIDKPGIVKFDWTSGNLDYKGVNVNSSASDDDTDWLIYKYTWVASNPTVIQKRSGSWTSRASLF